jgi:DNA-binding NarL/FixJ family response regulator
MAVRLIGATREVQTRLGVQPFGPVAKRVALVGQGLRQLLGAEEFERGLAAGRRLTLPEAHLDALTLAREGCANRTPSLVRDGDQCFGGLTACELDVLGLITEGTTDREIAEALYIAPKTANHHVTRILAKLEGRNRAATTALSFQHGLV